MKYFFTFCAICFFTPLYAQKFELALDAYSGLFHYGGNGTAATSFINEGNPDYTNNPYGSKNGFSYGGGLRLQYIAKSGFLVGAQVDYELLRSKVNINGYQPIYYYLDYGPANYIQTPNPANGQSFLQSQAINLSPFIGYRIKGKKIGIDLMPGVDFGFNLNAYDKGKATDDNGQTYHTDLKLADIPNDVRLRFGVAVIYGRFGITASYAYGLTNLYKNTTYSDGNYNAHSELVRFGLSYRIF
jgi:hypothetical protein